MSQNSKKYPPTIIFLFFTIAVLFTVTYGETIENHLHYLIKRKYLIERLLTLVIAFLYMLWERKDLFLTTARKPSISWGVPLLFISSLLLVTGQASNTQALSEMSFASSIIAIVVLLFGTDFARRFFLPLIFLFFLMTGMVEDITTVILRAPLQLLSAITVENLLTFFGYVIHREGLYLHLPNIVLEVAGGCSGTNQLIISIALGIAIAFIMLDDFFKRAVLIIWSFVMGLAVNWLRIFLISIWHYNSAKESIHGPYDSFNRLPYLVGLFFIFMLAVKLADKEKKTKQDKTNQIVTPEHISAHLESITQASFAAILILSTCSLYLYLYL
ncbi:exosortase [Candidatus Electrothrix aarhusensis]|uniref:Exosortase n=1 Tax=Candidatus Electrothrix aarhusensis TaxID=1859131 RepID=A0A3S3U9Y6_9BACT|nr:exosortase [Candidatus Electrothrix aarhusensis]